MAERIEHHKREATSLKDQLTVFVTTIQTQLIPDVHQKLALAKKNDLEQQLKDLATEIDSLSKEIGQKNNEYTQAMNSIAWGLVGGLVGVAITGSIFGSKAEQIRKEKNQLIDLKRHKVEELNTKQPISAAIRRLEVQFEDMHMRLTDALQSASNMETLWSMLAHYVKVSAENLEQITDNQGLLAFKLRFGPVIIPWDLIGGYTKQLVEVFDSAMEQYKLEQRKS
jgi:chromosome segregation ATPase